MSEGGDVKEVQEMDTNLDALICKFDGYFVVKSNIIHETAEEFYRSLRLLIIHCQYKDVEEQVRDRFMVGLRDRKLKERLQLTHILTLSKALEIARQDEQIRQQMREQNSEVSKEADKARSIRLLQHRLVALV